LKKILILFLIFICCLSTVSANDNISDDALLDYSQDNIFVDALELDDCQDNIAVDELEMGDFQEKLSAGDSPDDPITNADQLWLKFHNIGEGSTVDVYLADGTYNCNRIYGSPKNVTFIGQGENTILKGISTQADPGVMPSEKNYITPYTFVNLTFVGGTNDLSRSCKFINCTIIDSLTFSKYFHDNPDKLNIRRTTQDNEALRTYFYEFDNCVFKDYDGNGSYLTLYQYTSVSFNNCNFTNIAADSIACYANNVSYERIKNYLLKLGWEESEIERISYDGIKFDNCLFKDSKYTAITDSYTSVGRNITNCDDIKSEYYGVFTSDDGLHQYYSLPIPIDTILTVNVADIIYGESFIIEAEFNNPICDEVIVSISRNKYSVKVVNGTGSLKVSDELDAGVWNMNASSLYNNFNADSSFTINKIGTKLTAPVVNAAYDSDKYLVVTLRDCSNRALNYALVTVKIGSDIHNLRTDSNGQIKVSTNKLIPKTHQLTVSYKGDNNHLVSSANSKIVISKATAKLAAKKVTFKVKTKTKKYSIFLKNNKKAIGKVKVTLKVKGKTYKATTNAKGKATFKITKLAKKGTFTAKISFKGNSLYKAAAKSVKIKVKR
jgi:hypothetical protein